MDDLTNVWNNDDELTEQQLLKYLKGEATAEEAIIIEQKMAASNFLNDAVEGLQNVRSQNLENKVARLNEKLHKQLQKNKSLKQKRKIKYLQWVITSVIIVVILCVTIFAILYFTA